MTTTYALPPELLVLMFLGWVGIKQRDMLSFGSTMLGIMVYTMSDFIQSSELIVIASIAITAVVLLLDQFPDDDM